jgi:hypothetical protein
MKPEPTVYGLMAEFLTAQDILTATRRAWQAGYRRMDAYSPYPVEGLAGELGLAHSRIPSVVFIAGVVGAGIGFFMQYWSMAVDYPLNVGGRPHNSWPAFVQIAFEVLVLIASLGAILSMLFLCRLPQPHHPVFNVPRFDRASQDRFFLCIESADPQFDLSRTAEFLASLKPYGDLIEVPRERPTEPPIEVVSPEEVREPTKV